MVLDRKFGKISKKFIQTHTHIYSYIYYGVVFFFCIYTLLYLFIYLWLHWVFLAAHRLSLVAENRGYSIVVVCGLLIAMTSLVVEHRLLNVGASSWITGFRACGLRYCGSRALEPRLSSYGAWGSVAQQHVESFQIRGQTYVSYIGR